MGVRSRDSNDDVIMNHPIPKSKIQAPCLSTGTYVLILATQQQFENMS